MGEISLQCATYSILDTIHTILVIWGWLSKGEDGEMHFFAEHGPFLRVKAGMGDTRFWTGKYDTDKSCASTFSPIRYQYDT